jgi:DNA-binding GntR family transcriptional regulator
LQALDLKEGAAMQQELLNHIESGDKEAAAACVERLLAKGVQVLEQKYSLTK